VFQRRRREWRPSAALKIEKFSYKCSACVQVPPSVSSALEEFPGLRVSTITPSSIAFLQRCVDWQDVAPPRSAAFSTMQVPFYGISTFQGTFITFANVLCPSQSKDATGLQFATNRSTVSSTAQLPSSSIKERHSTGGGSDCNMGK
jgi:hypothetical protein